MIWLTAFLELSGSIPTRVALEALRLAGREWVVIRRGGHRLYVFATHELVRRLPQDEDAPIEDALGLHEYEASIAVDERPPFLPQLETQGVEASPSAGRYVELDRDLVVRAVGIPYAAGERSAPAEGRVRVGGRPGGPPGAGSEPFAEFQNDSEELDSEELDSEELHELAETGGLGALKFTMDSEDVGEVSADDDGGEEDEVAAKPLSAPLAASITRRLDPPRPLQDEGTSPLRYPSIEADRPLKAGSEVTVTVDLTRERSATTLGGALQVADLPADWTKLEVGFLLSCSNIVFDDDGEGTVKIRRNQDSVACTVSGTVDADAADDTITVMAAFFDGTRFCGSAVRQLPMAVSNQKTIASQTDTRGVVVLERGAVQPDLTVHISTVEGHPGRLKWAARVENIEGLPPKLNEMLDLGGEPAKEAAVLFAQFADLERGDHRRTIEGFGSTLWQRAPYMFRKVYWALWDWFKRPLTIQFVCSEPHWPWELMRPTRDDESETHEPLALKHSVARWLEDFEGYMPNRLPGGRIFTIAPEYSSISLQLPRAQTESNALVAAFGARSIPGRLQDVLTLLETSPPKEPVAVLHFAGHGNFSESTAGQSSIKLEDGVLNANQVARPEVTLGRECRTLVFFNACEVGAAGALLGQVGGWASALLGRRFGGFIAPLWAVDDDDAGVVARELLGEYVEQGRPIGEVLRDVRRKHGATSPTFYSYLYYGDVNAMLDSEVIGVDPISGTPCANEA